MYSVQIRRIDLVFFVVFCQNSNLQMSSFKLQNACLFANLHQANVDYAALIWEDLQYEIDNRQSKVRRHEIMPYSRFTKAIIHHFISQYKSISKRQGSPYHTVDNDGVLDRLKFIRKGEIHQTFISLSTGLIPPKIGRGKTAKGSKATVIPKKETVVSKNKMAKKIESSDEESKEEEEKAEAERLSDGAGLGPEVPDEPTGKSVVSDEGVGTLPEVPDETKDKHKAQDDLVDWGSTNDETFLFDDKKENPKDIPWVLGIRKYRSLPLISLDSSLNTRSSYNKYSKVSALDRSFKVGTEYQLADLFTKALPKECFEYLVHRIGMRCMTPTQLENLAKLSS
ncbi:hypothetical protein Tco_1054027 [Tanacetum coccineum]|uniref:Uncharacterized protein n=1 Tax=Tanacetum coccineum TaxID=301880 RepID=A0ABQ5GVL0_9ASTR